jgi:hypothetical protein
MGKNVDFIMKKTKDLSPEEIKQINSLFYRVFNKEKTAEKFNKQFMGTVLGYSYHGLMIDKGSIVGAYSAIPFNYQYYGKRIVFALSVDTMIDEGHRGNPFNLRKMADLVYNALVSDGIPFVFGFPNDKVYLVRKKILAWRDIGVLEFYVLPIRIGGMIKKLAVLNMFSKIVAEALNMFVNWRDGRSLPGLTNKNIYPIEKVIDESYLRYRYDGTYEFKKIDESAYYVYKIFDEENAKAAYLIDVYPNNKRMMEMAVKEMYMKEKGRIDLILYVGRLSFRVKNLIKVPARISPRRIHMSGKILIPDIVKENVFDIDNWNINLSNFDVR